MKNHNRYETTPLASGNEQGGDPGLNRGTNAKRYSRTMYMLGVCVLVVAMLLGYMGATTNRTRRILHPPAAGSGEDRPLDFLEGIKYLGVSETEYLHMTELSEVGTILCGVDGLVTGVVRVEGSVVTSEGKAVDDTTHCINVTKTCAYTMTDESDKAIRQLKEALRPCASVVPMAVTSIPGNYQRTEEGGISASEQHRQ